MALVYFHPGALMRMCVSAPGAALAAALWDGADAVATSRLTDLELRAVLASGHRLGKLDDATHAEAVRRWSRLWPAMWRVDPAEVITTRATTLAQKHPLRASDALHVACAEQLRSGDLVLLSWDGQFTDAARSEGLVVLP